MRLLLSIATVTLLAFAVACGSASRSGYALDVGDDADAGNLYLQSGGDAAVAVLDAFIEQNRVAVHVVTLSCEGQCAQVQAVAIGGNPPYTFVWSDGTKGATRSLCPSTTSSFDVTVTDTATSGELARPSQTARASVTADVLACPDAGAPIVPDASCADGSATTVPGLPETLALDTTGPVRYFAGGASLPAGRYRVEYVDGCMSYGPIAAWGWAIHTGMVPGNYWLTGMPYSGDCVLVGANSSNVVAVLPGTTNPPPGLATYQACVDANHAMDAPLDFDFAGGPLGMLVEDGLPYDDVGGQGDGGVTPTWKLSPVGVCP
jgi:hypothetical protein